MVDSSIGLLRLGVTKFNVALPPSFAFWQKFSSLFITEVCKTFGSEKMLSDGLSRLVPPSLNDIELFLEEAPFMRGTEYLNVERMITLWDDLSQALLQELIPFKGQVQDYLAAFNPAWNKVGRVCFHLAENKADSDHPFAFLATYTARLSDSENVTHLPLGRALKEYSGEKRSNLLSLLLPVQKAAEQSPFIKHLVDTGAIFQPLVWGIKEAYEFLKTIPLIEAAGVVVRVPNWWNPKKPPRPQITIAVGNANASAVGLDALLDFNMGFALPDGENLTIQELEELMKTQG
nr:SNF2 helicase-associated domain-containing protein [Alphaproteobacteria bacterium]